MSAIRRSRILLFSLFLAAGLGRLCAEGSPNLTWSLAFMRWTGLGYESLSFARPFSLAAKDEYQLFLKVGSSANCYVLREDPHGIVSVLSRTTLAQGASIYLPAADDSYSVGSSAKGSERIYVVVSLDRQKVLEKLLDNLVTAKGDGRAESDAILDEIARIKQSLSSLAEAPERPSPMGGVTRGPKPPTATEYSGQATYVKTIRFDH